MNSPFDNYSQAWAWAAGLFEGEGHIAYGQYTRSHRAYPSYRRQLVLAMADRDCVERFCSVVGYGKVKLYPKREERWSDIWRWECSRWEHIEIILRGMLPYLGERRTAKAEEMLANPARYANAPRKTHCLRGHELNGDNLYVSPDGRRNCRECNRIRGREYDAKRRAAKKAA